MRLGLETLVRTTRTPVRCVPYISGLLRLVGHGSQREDLSTRELRARWVEITDVGLVSGHFGRSTQMPPRPLSSSRLGSRSRKRSAGAWHSPEQHTLPIAGS